jgi:hypothetical protein
MFQTKKIFNFDYDILMNLKITSLTIKLWIIIFRVDCGDEFLV